MANTSISDQVDLRSLLEPGVHRQTLEQSYAAWMAAPNKQKSDLLLTGAALAWAEGWMLSNPESCSAGHKRYIVRSLAKSSGKAAGGQRAAENDELNQESRIYWVVIAVAAFVVFTLSPSLVRDGMERVINGTPKPEVVEKISSAAAKNQVTVTTTIGAPGQAPVTVLKPAGDAPAITMTDDGTPARSSEAPEHRAAAAIAPRLATRTIRDLAVERSRHLLALSDGMAQKGDSRTAMLVALEAIDMARSTERRDLAEGDATAASAASLFRAMMTTTPLLKPQATWTQATPPRFCGGGRRLLASSDNEPPVVFDTQAARPLQSFGAPEQLRTAVTVDHGCLRAVLATEDYGAEIVSLTTGKTLSRLMGHETDLSGMAFSPDGLRVVTASRDGSARIWDASTGRQLADLRGHDGGLVGTAFSPDGRTVVTWAEDKTVRLWDAASGRQARVLQGHKAAVTAAHLSPDGKRLATTSIDGAARLWDMETGRTIAHLEARQSSILSALFSQDGARLATMTQDSEVDIWDGVTGKRLGHLERNAQPARSLVFSHDAKLMATVSWSGVISLWQTETGEKIADLNRRGGRAISAVFSPDGDHVVAVAEEGTLMSWPVFASLDTAVAHAIRSAGQCLTGEERALHRLDAPQPAWCTTPVEAPQP